ncbi:uncharacterized protein N7479_006633 [Penicillium vulpinum]|uniref:Uncharacterized protein n=1 Tax=Penicillium vulpinum TaxID=29845 RepID=A0A1V6S228_9EURO|nr:uncharacterized protein N7479_006633 [Penicillium vulpinum]KAJ5959483.1 hypothetical protein N7479_006633 [Penicillium vulpinum]OQE08095.1 hypothetical protein PENVUL_c011G07763 [Penicillium vulpinum]
MGARSGLALVPVSGVTPQRWDLHSARRGSSNQSMYTSTYSAQADYVVPGVPIYDYAGADVRLLWWRLPPIFQCSNNAALQRDPLQVMGDFKLICRGMQCVLLSCVPCIGMLDAAGV